MTTEIHIHGPVTVWRPKEKPAKTRWRIWPDVVPNTGVVILMRIYLNGYFYYIAGYLDGAEFVDSAGRPVFRDDQDEENTVFERRTPDELHWIPLGDLLEGVE